MTDQLLEEEVGQEKAAARNEFARSLGRKITLAEEKMGKREVIVGLVLAIFKYLFMRGQKKVDRVLMIGLSQFSVEGNIFTKELLLEIEGFTPSELERTEIVTCLYDELTRRFADLYHDEFKFVAHGMRWQDVEFFPVP